MLKIIDCEQGSEEWREARSCIPTASEFKAVMSKGRKKGEPSLTRRTYMLQLAGEVVTGELSQSFSNKHTERGHEHEPIAIELYEMETGYTVVPCGFMKLDDVCGYSPDGLIDDNGLIEVKSKLAHIQLDILLKDEVPSEHIKQIQGGMWISGREWCDFISYCPGLPLFVKRLERDEKEISDISEAVTKFNIELKEIIKQIGGM